MIQLTLDEAKKLSILDIDIAMVRSPLSDIYNEHPCVIITLNGDYSLPEKHRYPDICGKKRIAHKLSKPLSVADKYLLGYINQYNFNGLTTHKDFAGAAFKLEDMIDIGNELVFVKYAKVIYKETNIHEVFKQLNFVRKGHFDAYHKVFDRLALSGELKADEYLGSAGWNYKDIYFIELDTTGYKFYRMNTTSRSGHIKIATCHTFTDMASFLTTLVWQHKNERA